MVCDGSAERVADALRDVGNDVPRLKVADPEERVVALRCRVVNAREHGVKAVAVRLHQVQLAIKPEEGVLASAPACMRRCWVVGVFGIFAADEPERSVMVWSPGGGRVLPEC